MADASKQSSAILSRVPWKLPVASKGEGIYIDLQDGRRLIDGVGGAAVACIGNGHPAVKQAIKDQVDKLSYVYNMQLSNEPAEELAQFLIDESNRAFSLCGFFCGGSEAMEAVIKLALQYWFEKKRPQRKNFIARHLSFHGNSLATLSLAHNPSRRIPYEALMDYNNFFHVSPAYYKRFCKQGESEEEYVQRLARELEEKILELGPDTVAGFVAETVVGATTGALPAPKGYFKAMREVCDKYDVLFILDEVMSGMGRMGTLHAWESFGDNTPPDIQAVAKGLGGGYTTIGAVLMSQKVVDGVQDKGGVWKHGHTYQAHPIGCAASLAVQKVIKADRLLERCRTQGEYLHSLLVGRLLAPNSLTAPVTFDIRGGGLFWGIEFDFESHEARGYDFQGKQFALLVQERCFSNGLVIMAFGGCANLEGTKGDHCLLSPAYTVTREELDRIVDIFVRSVEEILVGHML